MVDYSYRSDSDFNGEGIGLGNETKSGDCPIHSVTSVCKKRLMDFQSQYRSDTLIICPKVKEAQATFTDQCSDFDSVSKLLRDKDHDVRNDAATMLLEILKRHKEYHQKNCKVRQSLRRVSALLIVDLSTTSRITSAISDLKGESEVAKLLNLLALDEFGFLTSTKFLSKKQRIQLAIPRLESSDPEIQKGAVQVIQSFLEQADIEAVTKVASLLNRSTNELVQLAICDLLRSLTIDLASLHLTELIAFARDGKNDKSRVAAIKLIGRFGVDSLAAIPTLVKIAIRNDSQVVAAAAMKCIAHLDQDGANLFPSVGRQDCVELSEALRSIGVDGRDLRRSLTEYLKKPALEAIQGDTVEAATRYEASAAEPVAPSKPIEEPIEDKTCETVTPLLINGVSTSDLSSVKVTIPEDEKVLFTNEPTLLETMLKMEATVDSIASTREILKFAKLEIGGKRIFDLLKKYEYVRSTTRGFYLTTLGIERAKKITGAPKAHQ